MVKFYSVSKVNKMLEKLTLVIPTFNRYGEIYSLMEYLDKFMSGVNVIIMDGTPNKNQQDIDLTRYPNIEITYVSMVVGVNERIRKAMKMVKTKYVCLFGDDDRLVREGVESCIKFLDSNSDFISCYGKTYAYIGTRCHEMYNYSSGSRPFDIVSRVIGQMYFYTPQLYSAIWQKTKFEKAVSMAGSKDWKSGQVFEFLLVLTGNLLGNHYCLDEAFWERAVINEKVTEQTDRITTVSQWIEEYQGEYIEAKNILASNFKEHKKLIDLAFLEYMFFEENRDLMEAAGALTAKYRYLGKTHKYPASRVLKANN